jgi:hypothetical protein
MKKTLLYITLLCLLFPVSLYAQSGLTGMCLVVDQNQREWNGFGQIRRIDIDNGTVIQEDTIISDGTNCICPRFSPDGNKIAYIAASGSELVICDINGNNKVRVKTQTIESSGQNISWTENYIWVFRGLFENSDKIDKHNPVTGEYIETITLPQVMRQCYVSADETIAAGTKKNNGVGFISNFPHGNMQFKYVNQGCSSGPNPDGSLLCVNLWETCGEHQTMKIFNIDKINNTHSLQGYYSLDDGCNGATKILNLNDEYIWNHQMWAGHCNVVVLPIGHGGDKQLDDKQLPWVYDMDSQKWQKCYTGANDRDIVWHPYDFYISKTPGSLAYPEIQPTNLSLSVNKDGTNPSSNQDITLTNKGKGVFGQFKTIDSPAWLNTVITGNGNTQTVTISINTPAITSLDAKIYNDYVVLKAPVTGVSIDSLNAVIPVQLTVIGPSVLDHIRVIPGSSFVMPNDSIGFDTKNLDQYGNPISIENITWSVDCQSVQGSINATTGVFTGGTQIGGPYTVTAEYNGITGTAKVNVTDVWVKINCGSNDSVNGWLNDDDYLTNGDNYTWGTPPAFASSRGMAPESIYSSVVQSPGNKHSYKIPGNLLPPGVYNIRLHGSDSAGGQDMVYLANGDTLFNHFSWEDSIPGLDTAGYVVGEIKIEDNKGLTLECFSNSGTNVLEAGFELIFKEKPDFFLLTPQGGETYEVGDSLHVTWTGKDEILNNQIDVLVFLCLSPFEKYQISWYFNIPGTDQNKIPGGRKEWKWKIPEKIEDLEAFDSISIVDERVYIEVKNYNEFDITTQSNKFDIVAASGSGIANSVTKNRTNIYPNPTKGIIMIDAGKPWQATIYDALGNKIPFTEDHNLIDISNQPPGVYFININNNMIKLIKE